MDAYDWLVVVGLILLGVALWLAWGWVAALAYAGTVLLAAGVMGAAIKQQGGSAKR
jgi:hypothetical protein